MANSDWTEVDLSELPTEIRSAYDGYKAQYRIAKEAKAVFESLMQRAYSNSLETGSELKFGYNFGKLSIAIGPQVERKQSVAKPKQSLAKWLAAKQSAGDRS